MFTSLYKGRVWTTVPSFTFQKDWKAVSGFKKQNLALRHIYYISWVHDIGNTANMPMVKWELSIPAVW